MKWLSDQMKRSDWMISRSTIADELATCAKIKLVWSSRKPSQAVNFVAETSFWSQTYCNDIAAPTPARDAVAGLSPFDRRLGVRKRSQAVATLSQAKIATVDSPLMEYLIWHHKTYVLSSIDGRCGAKTYDRFDVMHEKIDVWIELNWSP
jgi:hypothetical protein